MLITRTNERVNIEREDDVNMKLRAAREVSGKTQAQVAKEIKIAERAYQNYEYGVREPGVYTAIRIAQVLNSTVEQLFGSASPDNAKIPNGNSVK